MNDLVWGMLLGSAVGLAAGYALGRLTPPRNASTLHRQGNDPARETAAPAGTSLLDQILDKKDPTEDLRQNLRVKLLYDEAKIDEAVAYERERAPHASEEELLRAAVLRWERDNR